jgi:hypothetical protein
MQLEFTGCDSEFNEAFEHFVLSIYRIPYLPCLVTKFDNDSSTCNFYLVTIIR